MGIYNYRVWLHGTNNKSGFPSFRHTLMFKCSHMPNLRIKTTRVRLGGYKLMARIRIKIQLKMKERMGRFSCQDLVSQNYEGSKVSTFDETQGAPLSHTFRSKLK